MEIEVYPPSHPGRRKFEEYRHKIFCRVLKFEPQNEDGIECDHFDRYSTYVVLTADGRIMGGCRLIPPSPCPLTTTSLTLPMLARGEYEGDVRFPCVEISRMIVSGRGGEYCHYLYGAICRELMRQDIWRAYAVVMPQYADKLRERSSETTFRELAPSRIFTTQTGKAIPHVPVEINVGMWAAYNAKWVFRFPTPGTELHTEAAKYPPVLQKAG